MMEPKVLEIPERLLVGMRIRTFVSAANTRQLWQRFKPAIKFFPGKVSGDFYSIQIYDDGTTFASMTPSTEFEKWAAVETDSASEVPEGMELIRVGGLYAVFVHKGLPGAFPLTAGFIYGKWIPDSDYEVDNRAQFEIMPADYRPDDPMAEEEVWVPIRPRTI